MNVIFKANKKERITYPVILFILFGIILLTLINAGIEHNKLYSRDTIIVFSVWLFLLGLILFDLRTQEIEVTDTELKYRNDYYFKKGVKLSDIVAAHITYGPKMQRNLTISTKDNGAVEIKMNTWSEDAYIKLFDELKRRNPSIDFDDRYDNALDAFGTAKYKGERKILEKVYAKDMNKWALWTVIGALISLAFLILSRFFQAQ